jgi:hypothetical protein
MKKIKLVLLLIPVLVGLLACKKEKETINLSTIEDLYNQPLPIIQKCIQGKWIWYVSYGGATGIHYPEDTYVNFEDAYCTISRPNIETQTISFVWKKLKPEPQFYNFSYDDETYFIC